MTSFVANAVQCRDLMDLPTKTQIGAIAEHNKRLLAPEEAGFLQTLAGFSNSTSPVKRSILQGRELKKIAAKARQTLMEAQDLAPEVKTILLQTSRKLDQQLEEAIRIPKVDSQFASDWTYRYAQILTVLYVPVEKRNSEYGYSVSVHDFEFTGTAQSYDAFKGRDWVNLIDLIDFWSRDSWYEHIKARDELTDLDAFVTDTKLGFDFFNQSLSITTQVVGFIYTPQFYDGRVGKPNDFYIHDYVHFNYSKSENMKDLRFRQVVNDFLKLYNEKMKTLKDQQAARLSIAVFLSQHEQDFILRTIYWQIQNRSQGKPLYTAEYIKSIILSMTPQAFLVEGFKKMPVREGKLIAEMLIEALQKNGFM